MSLGLVAGDKVSVLGRTCGRWCEIDGGIHLAGCVGIGIFPKQSVEQLAYQLEHSDTRVVFVEVSINQSIDRSIKRVVLMMMVVVHVVGC